MRRYERTFGSFERAFALPNSVDTEKIDAGYADGVLTVTIPKAEKARPREIPVRSTPAATQVFDPRAAPVGGTGFLTLRRIPVRPPDKRGLPDDGGSMYLFGVPTDPSLHVVGISHHTAGVELREQFSISPAEMTAWLERARESGHTALLLSTCNRCELYWYGHGEHEASFRNSPVSAGRADEGSCWSIGRGLGAVRHIFTVAAGLDSQILGETEILGQVRRAYDLAHTPPGPRPTTWISSSRPRCRRDGGVRRETMLADTPSSVGRRGGGHHGGVLGRGRTGRCACGRARSRARRRRECSRRFTRGVPRGWTSSTGISPGCSASRGLERYAPGDGRAPGASRRRRSPGRRDIIVATGAFGRWSSRRRWRAERAVP